MTPNGSPVCSNSDTPLLNLSRTKLSSVTRSNFHVVTEPLCELLELQQRVKPDHVPPSLLRNVPDETGSSFERDGDSQFDNGQGEGWQVFLRLRTLRPSPSERLSQ